ncbi:amidase [Nocardioides nitrophenolicus]|uniref:amidase n=1 Tax=Nocardioides nitrophenolicus TaxID=60489 RepID=UPI00195EF39A|nr:amidase [Nocardioides nitrophenolicus]MBM7519055.1 amidase [Nocardioides nitrophenolicus]
MTSGNALSVDSTAREQAAAVREREISARELLELHLDRIAERNPELNAIVSLDEERARSGAAAADEALASGAEVGPLHGLPFAFKDTHAVGGWRTTYGSPVMADNVPEHDELIVERVRAAGAVTIGKTNVPEFAAGSHTFNPVFGTTLNPVDPTRSAGGSSGGAACALAAGMVPLADGSDMGGSLRNPASFCGVVGMRPSLGRVPEWPLYNQWETTSVGGPMARNVGDLALLLSVMAGPDPRAPQALGQPGATFASPGVASLAGLRVALSVDLDGAFAVDHEVAAVVEAAGAALASAGASVSGAAPDLSLADDTFRTLRAWHFQAKLGRLLAAHPDSFKQSLADNIRAGESLTGADVARAYTQRTALSETMRTFFGSYDVLVLPVSQVPPFPATQEFPTEINGAPMATYLDWMRSAYFITVTGCPAISVPFGTTSTGLPVGVQLVARHGADLRLLEVAAAVEELAAR